MTESPAQQKHQRLKRSPIRRLRKRFFDAVARAKLKRSSQLWEYLTKSEAMTASTGCDFREYWWLYRYVTTKRPAYILECGAGISTLVIAFAIQELLRQGCEPPTFVSMEDQPFYYENLVGLLPSELKGHADLRLSHAVDTDFTWGVGRCYAEVPDHPYRFVFTDGPNLPADPEKPYFDCDYINVVRKQEATVVCALDGRKSTFEAYGRLLPGAKRKKLRNVGLSYIEASSADLVIDT